jgi:hypothetical protein
MRQVERRVIFLEAIPVPGWLREAACAATTEARRSLPGPDDNAQLGRRIDLLAGILSPQRAGRTRKETVLDALVLSGEIAEQLRGQGSQSGGGSLLLSLAFEGLAAALLEAVVGDADLEQ